MDIGIGMLFFIGHVLGDFYFSNQISLCSQNNIDKNYKDIIKHSVIYQIFFLLPIILIGFNTEFVITIFVIGISHYIIDTFVFLIQKNKLLNHISIKNNLFYIDQIIHVFIIFISLWYLKSETISSQNTLTIFKNDFYYIRLILGFLLIGKPSNIIFKKIFIRFKPASISKNDNELPIENNPNINAGATIGILERILILICIINGLYSSIGLILTAKSIARYNRISNEPAFSEYYLLGTLSSVLFTIITYVICFSLY